MRLLFFILFFFIKNLCYGQGNLAWVTSELVCWSHSNSVNTLTRISVHKAANFPASHYYFDADEQSVIPNLEELSEGSCLQEQNQSPHFLLDTYGVSSGGVTSLLPGESKFGITSNGLSRTVIDSTSYNFPVYTIDTEFELQKYKSNQEALNAGLLAGENYQCDWGSTECSVGEIKKVHN